MASGRRWFGDASISRGAKALLIATTLVSVGFMLAGKAIQLEVAGAAFASGDALFRRFEAWTFVTSPLIEPDFVALLFQGLMLWLFLPTLERWWGTKKFLLFALYTSLAGVAGGSLIGWLLGGEHAYVAVTGLDPFTFAGILAFGVLYASQPVRFFGAIPMTGRQLAIGITVFTFVLLVLGQRWVEGGASASAMLLAWIMTSTRGSPKLWWLKWRQARVRRRLGVVDGGKKWVN
jgi:membrane associated rhomboid family serine protease